MTSTLPTSPLGTTDMHLTRVGLGAWAIGGAGWSFGWGAQEDGDSVRAIARAAELGVNWVDTAGVYGLGHSEVVTGRALKAIPEADRPYVFTKGGLVWDAGHPEARASRVGEPASVRQDIEDSLRRLDVERIDLFQIHWPAEDGHGIDEYWQVLADAVDAGKGRALGLSNHPVALLEQAEEIRHVDSLQPPFNMMRRGAAHDVIPWCHDHGTGVIVYSPMASGVLTGRWTRERAEALPSDDWRHASADHAGEHLDRNLALVERLRPIAERHDVSVGAVAIAWTLAWPGVTGAIVGARSPEQVDGWIDAATLELDAADLAIIGDALGDLGIGDEPTAP